MERMARAVLLGLLTFPAIAAAQAPGADNAGNRILPFAAVAQISDEARERRSAVHCDAERSLCLQAWRGDGAGWTLDLHDGLPTRPNGAVPRSIALPEGEDSDRETHTIWPQLIREASGALLIGVARERTTGFSGGGAGATQLLLFRLASPGAEPVEVLTVQTRYSATIRACFSEDDYRSRGSCHDEYEMSGTLALAPEAGNGRPRLVFTTAARSFPRGVRADQTERRRYRRADLVWEADPACSYRRSLTADPATGRYALDTPLPDCSLYALP